MSTPFNIDVGGDRDKRLLVLRGELDVSNASQLDATLRSLYSNGAREIVVDLRGLRFMDSSGLRAILAAHSLCPEHGCQLFIDPALPWTLRRLFALTKVGQQLDFKAHSDMHA